MAASGYSGTPLAQKLGLKPGMRAWFLNMPDSVRAEVERNAPPVERLESPEPPVDLAHIFVTSCAALDCELRMLLPLIARDGMIWVSWPKKASRVPTDITEDVIREIALRGRRDLVRAQAGNPPRASLTFSHQLSTFARAPA